MVRIQLFLGACMLLVVRKASRIHTSECIELRTRHRSSGVYYVMVPKTLEQPRDSRRHSNRNGRRGRAHLDTTRLTWLVNCAHIRLEEPTGQAPGLARPAQPSQVGPAEAAAAHPGSRRSIVSPGFPHVCSRTGSKNVWLHRAPRVPERPDKGIAFGSWGPS